MSLKYTYRFAYVFCVKIEEVKIEILADKHGDHC